MKVVSYGEPPADSERAPFAFEALLLPRSRLTTSSAPA